MASRIKARSDRRDVIAQALLDGCDPARIHARLVSEGASPKSAEMELKRAERDPLYRAALRLANQRAKRDWTLDIYARLAAQDTPLGIPTVDAIEPERFYREFYAANRPVKLTGLVDHWPALERWTLDYLEEKVGTAQVEIQAERTGHADYEADKDRHRRGALMRDVIAFLRSDPVTNDFYITAANDTRNKQALAALWDDLAPVSILQPSGGRDGFFWLGPAGTLTPFHHDLTNNLLVQVTGRKQVRMVPSWEVARMRNSLHCFSDRSPEDFAPDSADRTAPPMLECTIDRGEAIFLPIGWWHHVTALDRSISMSFTNFQRDNNFTGGYPAMAEF